jgi:hypothetical protein
VLRPRGLGATWVPVQVTVNRIDLKPVTFAGLVSMQPATGDQLADAGLPKVADHTTQEQTM